MTTASKDPSAASAVPASAPSAHAPAEEGLNSTAAQGRTGPHPGEGPAQADPGPAAGTGAEEAAPAQAPASAGSWPPPSTDKDLPPCDPLEAIRSSRPWPGSSPSPADAAQSEQVWSGSTSAPPQALRRKRRPTTVAWGLLVASVGALLVAVGAGLRIDLVMATILMLAGLGTVLLVLAVVPQKKKP